MNKRQIAYVKKVLVEEFGDDVSLLAQKDNKFSRDTYVFFVSNYEKYIAIFRKRIDNRRNPEFISCEATSVNISEFLA